MIPYSRANGPESEVDPDAALGYLLEGNQRFVDGRPRSGGDTLQRRARLVEGQAPYAAIVSCADSRVSPNLVFDAGLGGLFSNRVAGNVVDATVLGSLEYAVLALGIRLIVILGHQSCGAVTAAVRAVQTNQRPTGYLAALIDPILPAVMRAQATMPLGGDLVDTAIDTNVQVMVEKVRTAMPVLSSAVQSGRIQVVGMRYSLATGEATLIVS